MRLAVEVGMIVDQSDDVATGTTRHPRVIVTFADVDSVKCDVTIEPGVGPLQLYAMAEFLRFHADLMMRAQMASRVARP